MIIKYILSALLMLSNLVYAKGNTCQNNLTIDLSVNTNLMTYSGCQAGEYTVEIINIDNDSSYSITHTIEGIDRETLVYPNEVVLKKQESVIKDQKVVKSFKPQRFTLGNQQKLTVIVTEKKVGKETTWTLIIDTKDKRKWVASWSIAIVPNKDAEYYTNELNDSGTYIIQRKPSNNDYKLIPAVFYTNNSWGENKNWHAGPTLGLGLDTDNLTPFAGINATYKDNVGLTAGVSVYKRKTLLGEYANISEENPLRENITTLTEDKYKAGWFIALTYRFK